MKWGRLLAWLLDEYWPHPSLSHFDPDLSRRIDREQVRRIHRELTTRELRSGLEELRALRTEAELDRHLGDEQ